MCSSSDIVTDLAHRALLQAIVVFCGLFLKCQLLYERKCDYIKKKNLALDMNSHRR